MRTFKLLFCLMLIPFLGNAQSVTVSSTYDSLASPCVTTGTSVALMCSGNTSGITAGDTIDIYADYGNGPVLEDKDDVSNNAFWASWSHTFNTAGAHVVDIIAVGPNGNSDTAQHTIIVSDSCSTVQGTAYLDTNNNCYYDNGEPLLKNRHLKIYQGGTMMGYAMTSNAGQYQFDVATGQTYSITMHDTGVYSNSCPPSGTQSVSNFPAYGVDFGLTCSGSGDFAVDYLNPGWGFFRPEWQSDIYFGLEGIAYCGNNASCVKMVLPPSVNAHDSLIDSAGYSVYTPAFDTIIGDTVVWDLTDSLTINDLDYGMLPVYTDSSAVLGDTVCVQLMICTSDQDPSNDMMEVCVPVVNSYDPNNKLVLPRGQGQANYIAPDQQMTYTINFQNTGTAPAIDVRIEDTLSTGELDQSTFKVVSSSHPITQVKVKNNNIIKFYFDDIMLPDSGVSQSASKGYVRFNIDQQPGLSDGTEITNSGAIFFDQNPPIITNEALNTIGTPTSVADKEGEMSLDIYPNPAEDQLNITSGQMIEGDVVLRDMVGKQVAQKPINGNKATLDLQDLPGGVYILSIRTVDGKNPVREKVIVK